MWKNTVELGRPQMPIWRMLDNEGYKYTRSRCVILGTFARQRWLHESTSTLRYTYIVCLVFSLDISKYKALMTCLIADVLWSSVITHLNSNMYTCECLSVLQRLRFDSCNVTSSTDTFIQHRKNIRLYEGWNFNSGNYLFTTDTK